MMPLWLLSLGGALKRIPWQVWAALALALAWHSALNWHRHKIERMLHHADATGYARAMGQVAIATAKARKLDADHKASVEAAQQKITERTDHDYQVRLAAARATAERLRHVAEARRDPGSGRSAPVPGVPDPAGVADGAAPQGGLSVDDALTATEQAIQLDELQKWIRGQTAVPRD